MPALRIFVLQRFLIWISERPIKCFARRFHGEPYLAKSSVSWESSASDHDVFLMRESRWFAGSMRFDDSP